MPERAYLSNINSAWPFERQEALLAERVPGWPISAIYRDQLKPRHRKAHNPESLKDRATMLRPTSRQGGETIYVASLSVLAWDGQDFEATLAVLARRGARVTALAEGAELDPTDLGTAMEVFRRSRKRASVEARQRAGSAISAERRKSASKARAALVEPYWALSSDQWPRKELERISGLSWNTLKRHLGRRDIEQRRHEAKMKRKAREQQRQAT